MLKVMLFTTQGVYNGHKRTVVVLRSINTLWLFCDPQIDCGHFRTAICAMKFQDMAGI